MKLVVFGLSVTSSWGNGHATLWRGLIRSLAARGVATVFFERDAPWYAAHRDLTAIPGGDIVLYADWEEALPQVRRHLREADVGMVTSYCPDGIAAGRLLAREGRALRAFYDLDTPETVRAWRSGESLSYVGPDGLADYDLVFSYTGGGAVAFLREHLGARRVETLFGHVDPAHHRPAALHASTRADLSFLGTYAKDRQASLLRLFVEPARRRPDRRFLLAGAQYPDEFPWLGNIRFQTHVPPADHPRFFASARITLNVTRAAMASLGWCPSGRLFEAAACGVPLLSDRWPGVEDFFLPGEEILVADTTEEVLAGLDRTDGELARLAEAARARVLKDHTSARRADQLIRAVEDTMTPAMGR